MEPSSDFEANMIALAQVLTDIRRKLGSLRLDLARVMYRLDRRSDRGSSSMRKLCLPSRNLRSLANHRRGTFDLRVVD